MGIKTENVAIVMAECDTCGRMEPVPADQPPSACADDHDHPLPPGWIWRQDRDAAVCWPCLVLRVLDHMRHYFGRELFDLVSLAEATADGCDLYDDERDVPDWIFALAVYSQSEDAGDPNSMKLMTILRYPPEPKKPEEQGEPATAYCPGGCGNMSADLCAECHEEAERQHEACLDQEEYLDG